MSAIAETTGDRELVNAIAQAGKFAPAIVADIADLCLLSQALWKGLLS
ncbi:hypothetical protein ACN4EK_08970 [Pantanalinema rosaneae CENA516]